MQKSIIIFSFFITFCQFAFCQKAGSVYNKFPKQYICLQGGLTLLEAPAVFYPNIGISYSKTFIGNGLHQLAINPQFQFISLPTIENKLLFSANAEYKLQTKWRLEVNLFLGINYQLRRFAYDRYEYIDGKLENTGNIKYQIGPTLGSQLGYKILRRKTFSLSPYAGFSLTKLRNSYTNTFSEGFVPSAFFGFKLNLNK